MVNSKLKTPILFLIFNRPSTTKVVFEAIRQAQPAKLYLAADGPRHNKAGELELCQEVKSIVANVDWECEVKRLFREENLGCGKAVSSAITWFFENEPEGIVLEDDCLPNASFFSYCAALLETYRHDSRVMEISGNNLRPEAYRQNDYSYSFSNYNGIWGWATWRRAWNMYDYEMKNYKKIKETGYLEKKYTSIFERDYFNWVFERTYLFPHITWDYQWEFVKRINSALTIVPQKNLVVNIGFGDDATSTTNTSTPGSNLKSEGLVFPLKHPPFVMADVVGDNQAFIFYMTTFASRMKSYIKKYLPAGIQNKMFKTSMNNFIKSQESNQEALKRLKEKSSAKILSWSSMVAGIGEFEIDLELICISMSII